MFDELKRLRDSMCSEANVTPTDDRAHLYSSSGNKSSEFEVSALLAALVYAIKPKRILETGTYRGQTTRVLGHAAMTYDGMVIAIDNNAEYVAKVKVICKDLPVTVLEADSMAFKDDPFDFAFIDCREERRDVLLALITNGTLAPGAFVAIHDSAGAHGGYQQYITSFLLGVQIPTPRGLWLGTLRA